MTPAWRATGPDGIAHAFRRAIPRAACGAPNQPERFDWPSRSRCPICQQREEVRSSEPAQLPTSA